MNIIITAPKHLGKSTAIRKIIDRLPDTTSGFITEFIDRDCADRKLMLRSINGSVSRCAVTWKDGKHYIDYSVFDDFAPGLVDFSQKFIVIDELGKFENCCDKLRESVQTAFDSPCHVIASIRLDAQGWMQELKNRDDVLLFELDENNRDSLPDRISHILGL